MKTFTRKLLMSIALCFALVSVDAQFVTIPDANFVSWLNTHGFASCMNGNQMDTTCSAVVNATSIDCSNIGFIEITGISYFKHLTHLECHNCGLTFLPTLPPLLTYLDCNSNVGGIGFSLLNNLPPLPSSLTTLICNNNSITSLPALPASLTYLDCNHNFLSVLPNLPASLIYLDCSHEHQLTSLPILPASLTTLNCNINQLASLPALSTTLTNLNCSSNPLHLLPALPSSLTTLDCNYDSLTSLPLLPSILSHLDCSNNLLTSLPYLPSSMNDLWIQNNPNLTCLTPINSITNFNWNNTSITSFPNNIAVVNAFPSITGIPICTIPTAPKSITVTGGAAKVCPGDTRIYSTPLVAGVTYNWTVPTGAVINSGQGTRTINVSFNNNFISGSNISVVKIHPCGVLSAPKTLIVNRNVPSTPSAITGLTYGLCGATNKTYSVTQVAGMTYQWIVPAVATIVNGQGTNSIIVNFNSTNFTGTVSVKAVNGCGAGNARNLTVRAIPPAPLSITGPATACAHQQNVAYSTAAVASATAYTWLVPSGALITSGQGTTSIMMNYGTAAGNVRVRAANACGNSGYRSLTVTINCREETADMFEGFDILVYPNPSKNIFSISISNSSESNYSLFVRDMIGRIIYQQSTISTDESFDFGAELSSGMYFIEIKQGDERKIVRLIKSN